LFSKNLSAIEVILLLFYYYRELDEDLAYIHCRSIGRSREENMGSKGPGSLMYMNVAGGSWRKVIFKKNGQKVWNEWRGRDLDARCVLGDEGRRRN